MFHKRIPLTCLPVERRRLNKKKNIFFLEFGHTGCELFHINTKRATYVTSFFDFNFQEFKGFVYILI